MKNTNPSQTKSWALLTELFKEYSKSRLTEMFDTDPKRFDKYTLEYEDILFDFSKNHINDEILASLIDLAEEVGLREGVQSMYGGEVINVTEQRAVLHTALRAPRSTTLLVDGIDVIPQIHAVKERMKRFADQVHSGEKKGHTGRPLTHIVNIGIGGSDLGPVMVTEALKPYWIEGIKVSFVSNIDGSHISEVLKEADPHSILFIIASKTLTTQETMTNAYTARQWLLDQLQDKKAIGNHFIALSTNVTGAMKFGIEEENIFPFWDWVGGRFSLSSAIGMSIVLTIGYDNFDNLLSGMHSMDTHFKNAPFKQNMPVLMALIGIWYNNFYGVSTEAILPYDQYLHRFAAYFQQANMESNGKSTDRNGTRIDYQTGPIIWGEPGTNGQHAFYQLIHQGTKVVHCDFIAPANSHNPIGDHHAILLSNFFAQSEALMNGKSEEEVVQEYEQQGIAQEEYKKIVPFKVFEGNRPSNSLLIKKITPYTLGQMIALYEHKIFTQGYIWNIYSFDQWGVQLGKVLAKKILPQLSDDQKIESHDSSTNGLINAFKKYRTT